MNLSKLLSSSFVATIGAILATGLLLEVAGSGALGKQVQSVALRVTKGYGQ